MDNTWDEGLEGILKDLSTRKERSKKKTDKDLMVIHLKDLILCLENDLPSSTQVTVHHDRIYSTYTVTAKVGHNG